MSNIWNSNVWLMKQSIKNYLHKVTILQWVSCFVFVFSFWYKRDEYMCSLDLIGESGKNKFFFAERFCLNVDTWRRGFYVYFWYKSVSTIQLDCESWARNCIFDIFKSVSQRILLLCDEEIISGRWSEFCSHQVTTDAQPLVIYWRLSYKHFFLSYSHPYSQYSLAY